MSTHCSQNSVQYNVGSHTKYMSIMFSLSVFGIQCTLSDLTKILADQGLNSCMLQLKSMHIRITSETGEIRHAFTFVKCKFLEYVKIRHCKFSEMSRSFNVFNLCQFIGIKILGLKMFKKCQHLSGTKSKICLLLSQTFTEIIFLAK